MKIQNSTIFLFYYFNSSAQSNQISSTSASSSSSESESSSNESSENRVSRSSSSMPSRNSMSERVVKKSVGRLSIWEMSLFSLKSSIFLWFILMTVSSSILLGDSLPLLLLQTCPLDEKTLSQVAELAGIDKTWKTKTI